VTYAFYDSRIWQDLCGKAQITSTSIARSPGLLRLEPNANTKIIRRDFFVRSGIEFPEGLLFEDLPAHFSVLLKAARVGLINFTGYYYRVSRAGKITDERSARRFDMIKVGHQAVDLLLEPQVSPKAAAAGLLMVTRMLFWCGEMTPNSLREEYLHQAFALLGRMPGAVIMEALRLKSCTGRERLILLALATSDRSLVSRLCGSNERVAFILTLRWPVLCGLARLTGASWNAKLRSTLLRPSAGPSAKRAMRRLSFR
jgi:hypothetical protein